MKKKLSKKWVTPICNNLPKRKKKIKSKKETCLCGL